MHKEKEPLLNHLLYWVVGMMEVLVTFIMVVVGETNLQMLQFIDFTLGQTQHRVVVVELKFLQSTVLEHLLLPYLHLILIILLIQIYILLMVLVIKVLDQELILV